jgi:hypothetical protein
MEVVVLDWSAEKPFGHLALHNVESRRIIAGGFSLSAGRRTGFPALLVLCFANH